MATEWGIEKVKSYCYNLRESPGENWLTPSATPSDRSRIIRRPITCQGKLTQLVSESIAIWPFYPIAHSIQPSSILVTLSGVVSIRMCLKAIQWRCHRITNITNAVELDNNQILLFLLIQLFNIEQYVICIVHCICVHIEYTTWPTESKMDVYKNLTTCRIETYLIPIEYISKCSKT